MSGPGYCSTTVVGSNFYTIVHKSPAPPIVDSIIHFHPEKKGWAAPMRVPGKFLYKGNCDDHTDLFMRSVDVTVIFPSKDIGAS